MKKLLFSVAAAALVALTANAATGFTLDSESFPGAVDDGTGALVTSQEVTELNSGIVINPTASCAELQLQPGAITSEQVSFKISDISFTAQGPGDSPTASPRTSWKIYPNYIASNTGSGNPTAVIPTTAGETIKVLLGNSAQAITYTVTGADLTSIASPKQDTGMQPVEYTLIASGSEIKITLPNKARVYAITGSSTGIGDITLDGCKVTGYYNVLGQKLADEPANGVYIETYENCPAQKFVKK